MAIAHTKKWIRVAGKMKKPIVIFFVLAMTGCAFDIQDWEPKDDVLLLSVQKCREEMLLRPTTWGGKACFAGGLTLATLTSP